MRGLVLYSLLKAYIPENACYHECGGDTSKYRPAGHHLFRTGKGGRFLVKLVRTGRLEDSNGENKLSLEVHMYMDKTELK